MSVVAVSPKYPLTETFGQAVLDTDRSLAWQDLPTADRQSMPGLFGPKGAVGVVAVEPQRSASGHGAWSFSDEWYNQIHVNPPNIDFGNITGTQTADIEVWNGFFVPQVLDAVTLQSQAGVSVQQPSSPPVAYNPLESQTYTVTAQGDGPPAVNATLTFDWTFVQIEVGLTGQRIVPWVYPPDWDEQPIEFHQYKTEILTGWNGTEQRIQYRDKPRIDYEFAYRGDNRNAQRMRSVLWSWQARTYAVPLWHQEQVLGQSLSIGDNTISLDTTDLGYRAGGLLCLFRTTDRFEIVPIDSVSASSITLTKGVESTWAADDLVMPVMVARLEDQQTVDTPTDRALQMSARWRVTEYADPGTEPSGTMYKNKPVLLRRPNWTREPDIDFERQLEVLDSGWHRTFDDPYERARTTQRMLYMLNGRAEIDWFRRWLHGRKGRQKAFWCPTWWDDFDLANTIASGASTIEVFSIDFPIHLLDRGRNHLMLETVGGNQYFREITSASTSSDGERDVLSLDAAIPEEVTAAQVHELCFLVEVRLDTDRAEITHITGTLAEVELPVRTV